ncbi:hypothetical protein Agabi119p4_3962 [Agaricus bisporus var. burnettii]|uniref:Uncharacterized protein n=1 Tax=Agaricus bisporus var. burnettii TaxID=192524 RepID=A0A8H7F5T2_AGABI|nr:hypothetical protein Agabi119p4_3962 [Agaricus bisporus var. burnettii]
MVIGAMSRKSTHALRFKDELRGKRICDFLDVRPELADCFSAAIFLFLLNVISHPNLRLRSPYARILAAPREGYVKVSLTLQKQVPSSQPAANILFARIKVE